MSQHQKKEEYRAVSKELLDFIENSPTSFHVAANAAGMLEEQGYRKLWEGEDWRDEEYFRAWRSGEGRGEGKFYVMRNDSSLIAFHIPALAADVSAEAADSSARPVGASVSAARLSAAAASSESIALSGETASAVSFESAALSAAAVPWKGFHIAASHGDSPCFKLKENPEMLVENRYMKLNVEKYGGMILSSWFDRALSVAGRLIVQEGENLETRLVNLKEDLLVIPSVAIHLTRDSGKGTEWNAQVDMLPLYGGAFPAQKSPIQEYSAESGGSQASQEGQNCEGSQKCEGSRNLQGSQKNEESWNSQECQNREESLEFQKGRECERSQNCEECLAPQESQNREGSLELQEGQNREESQESQEIVSKENSDWQKVSLLARAARAAGVEPEKICGQDLFLYVNEPGRFLGTSGEFLLSPRLDDQQCVFASLKGFLDSTPREYLNVFALFDNEEVGSGSRQGADSDFLEGTLYRVCEALGLGEGEYRRLVAGGFLLSADNAHGVHPNHPEKSDPTNRPYLNGGIVLKFQGSQKYTTDGLTAARVRRLCERAKVPCQTYANRSDIPGGSTLGRISVAHVSIPSADIGLPQLAMHSAVETAGAWDADYGIRLFRTFWSE